MRSSVLTGNQSTQQKCSFPPACRGRRTRLPFHVQAGLNYPHMPNRLRRQRQELIYRFIRQRDRATSKFVKSPAGQHISSSWQQVLQLLSPYLSALVRFRDYVKWTYREQLFDFYDYTMDETKRKYKWEAYTEQEKKWWIDLLTFIGDRIAVVVGYAAFIIAMPCSVLWTLIVPLLLSWRMLEDKPQLRKYFWLVLIVMQPIKHPLSRPIRWFL